MRSSGPAVVALAWLAGVVAAALGWAALWPPAAGLAAGLCVALLLLGRRRQAAVLAALALVAAAGALRHEAARPPPQPGGVAAFNGGGAVTLRGVVVSEPEERELSQRFTLRAEAYLEAGAWRATEGRVLVSARLFPRLRYGDEVELRGELQTPPGPSEAGGFDYREYLARRGVVSLAVYPSVELVGREGGNAAARALFSLRRRLGEALARSLPEPEGALARGVLLGERAAIPDAVMDDLNRAGVSHLVVISGYNVTLVAGFVVAACAWLVGRRRATVLAMAAVLAYAAFVGGGAPVLRAAVMALVMLGATLAGRPAGALSGVLLAGAVLTAWRPLAIQDVSFQLSFTATLGMVLLAPPLAARLAGGLSGLPTGAASFLAEQAAVTTAASLAVLPIIAANFGRVALVAVPANLLAVPLFPFVLGASFLTAAAGAAGEELGRTAGLLAQLPVSWFIALGQALADIPFASPAVAGVDTALAAALYLPLAALTLLLRRLPAPAPLEGRPALPLRPTAALAVPVLALAVWTWWSALDDEDGRLRVSVLDVGQGDAVLIETPDGRRVLVDGGPSGERLAQALGRELPPHRRRIDLVVLTHGQDDHVSGLVTVLERYDVGCVLTGSLPGSSAAYEAWQDALARRGLCRRFAVAGDWVDLGSGVRLEVLGPPSPPLPGPDELNENSVVLRLVYGEVSFLLTGDLAATGEEALLSSGADLRATVLKVAHHGSDGSTTPAFLAAVRPRLAVISVGAGNTYGHPSPSLELALRLAGAAELRTDQNGGVRLVTDGKDLWVGLERGGFRVPAAAAVGGSPNDAPPMPGR